MKRFFVVLCALCIFVVNIPAQEKPVPAPDLTQAEREELAGLTTSWQAVNDQMTALQAEWRALSKIRVELSKKMEDFAERAVIARGHKKDEAHLDLNGKRVVKSQAPAATKPGNGAKP